jgi:hypothetical protein
VPAKLLVSSRDVDLQRNTVTNQLESSPLFACLSASVALCSLGLELPPTITIYPSKTVESCIGPKNPTKIKAVWDDTFHALHLETFDRTKIQSWRRIACPSGSARRFCENVFIVCFSKVSKYIGQQGRTCLSSLSGTTLPQNCALTVRSLRCGGALFASKTGVSDGSLTDDVELRFKPRRQGTMRGYPDLAGLSVAETTALGEVCCFTNPPDICGPIFFISFLPVVRAC